MTNDFASDLAAIALFAGFGVAILAYVVLIIAALVGIISARLSGGMKLVWCFLVFLAPFLGSILWFVVGRKNTEVLTY